MERSALEWYELLAKGLIWAACIVLFLSVIGAVMVVGGSSSVPGLEDAERQGRGFAAIVSLFGGLTSAGLLAGLGAILRLLVAARLARLGPDEPAAADGDE